ncbi:MAG TPA: DedA family protein [Nevskiaceae bacterium]|nr:DedA family protein [Nevskiaceae bacterium]
MDALGSWLKDMLDHLGYGQIVFLMALESSLFPVPSELVMIPAGYRAAQGHLDPWLATACGGLGSLLGAAANYALGKFVGRTILVRYGRYFLINQKTFLDAEGLFLRNANTATFVGRFLPGIRHLISIPPGMFGMALAPFALLTALGATLWCGVLVAMGYFLGESAIELVMAYTHELAIVCAIGLVALTVWFVNRRRRASAAAAASEGATR